MSRSLDNVGLQRIHIDQPNKKARAGMLRLMVGKHSALSDSELGRFADHSEGFSAADVNGVAKDAFAQANRDLFAATVCRYVNLTGTFVRTVTTPSSTPSRGRSCFKICHIFSMHSATSSHCAGALSSCRGYGYPEPNCN